MKTKNNKKKILQIQMDKAIVKKIKIFLYIKNLRM